MGRLLVVATPIGNLDDLSTRAREALASAAVVYCEDTRRTGNLFARYGLTTPRVSCHGHNEHHRVDEALERLARGRDARARLGRRHAARLGSRRTARRGGGRGRAPRGGDSGAVRGSRDPLDLGLFRRPVHVPRLPALAPRRAGPLVRRARRAPRDGRPLRVAVPRSSSPSRRSRRPGGIRPSSSGASSRSSTRRSSAGALRKSRASSEQGPASRERSSSRRRRPEPSQTESRSVL